MVYVFLANGFEEIEALSVVDILRRAEIETKTVGVTGKEITGTHGITVKADITVEDVDKNDIDAVVLPGGMPGAVNLKNSAEVEQLLLLCVGSGKVTAAICAAPLVLGNLGLLENKTATCYPGFEEELKGAKILRQNVCVDGNIITASGPAAANEFAFALVDKLKNSTASAKIRKGMLFEV